MRTLPIDELWIVRDGGRTALVAPTAIRKALNGGDARELSDLAHVDGFRSGPTE
jgi:hypothetical protein